ncbi:MAG: hypothetical protein KDA24_07965, partial [Deltaproteobacteria bacterium]|nr:hypothetical protein [Deltaproteobacteria bacterium]
EAPKPAAPKAAAPKPPAPKPPAPKPPPTPPAPEEDAAEAAKVDSTRRVISTPPLAGKTPSPGQAPITGNAATVEEAPAAKPAPTPPPGASKPKKGSNTALFAAIGVLGVVIAGFVFVFLSRGGDPAPAPAPETAAAPAPAAAARLSQDLRMGDVNLGEGAAGDATSTAIAGYSGLGIKSPADASDEGVRAKVTAFSDTLQAECKTGARFDACQAWSRAAYAVFAGCQAANCDGGTSGQWFVQSIEATDLALTRATALTDAAARTKATRLLAAQAIRLGSANQKTVAARAPRIAALGSKSCAGSASTSADCQALTRSQ